MKPKNILIVFSSLLFLYFVYNMVQVLPKMFTFVNSFGKLEEDQEITDTVFFLKNKKNEVVTVYLNQKRDSINLIFIPGENQFNAELVEMISKDINPDTYVITFAPNLKSSDKIPFQVYFTDTINLPLKYKKILIPYKIQIRKDTIFKATYL